MTSSIPIKVLFPQSSHHDVHIAGFVAEYARELGMDGNEWDVITELSRYQWGKLEVTPTLRTIAMRLRCIQTENEISRIKLTSRYLNSLADKGLLVITCNTDAKGRTIGNTYDLRPLFQKAHELAVECGFFDTLKMGYEDLHTPTVQYPLPPLYSTPTPTVQYPSIERVSIEENQDKEKESTTFVDATHTTATDTLTTPLVKANGSVTVQHAITQSIAPETTTTPPSSEPPPTKTPLIVNMTNSALGRTPPPNLTEQECATWLKQKPVWSLFAEWHIMNITDGEFDDWRTYKEHAAPMQWDEVVAQAQNMGKWLDQHAKKAKVTLTYQWVIEWHRWYVATVMNEKIDKYPTTKDGFKRNFALYIDYLHQLSKKEPNQ